MDSDKEYDKTSAVMSSLVTLTAMTSSALGLSSWWVGGAAVLSLGLQLWPVRNGHRRRERRAFNPIINAGVFSAFALDPRRANGKSIESVCSTILLGLCQTHLVMMLRYAEKANIDDETRELNELKDKRPHYS
jgi:hypothetical protein